MRRLGQLLIAALTAMTLWIFFLAGAGYWIQNQVSKKLKLELTADHRIDFARPSFLLQNLNLDYRGELEILSGNLKVRYNLIPMTPDLLHVRISGQGIKGRLKGKLAQVPGGDQLMEIKRFEVELKLVPRGVMLIAADIDSPVFQFKIKKSENPKGQLLT